jgi:hypothetical protein
VRWKVYMDSYMASNDSCFVVTWIIFQNHLLEVGLIQNKETMALRNLTIVDLLYSAMCEDPKYIEIHMVEGHVTYEFPLHLRARDQTT